MTLFTKRWFLLATALFALLSDAASAQDGYYHLNGRRFRYRGDRIGLHGRLSPEAHYNAAREAGKNMTYFYRLETGIGYVFAPATFTQRHLSFDNITGELKSDTAYSISSVPSSGFQITSGSGYPIATFNKNSAMLFTYAFSARFLSFKPGKVTLDGKEREYTLSNKDFSAILSIDYKSGSEAMLDRSRGMCFTMGAGIEPIWLSGQYSSSRIFYHKLALMMMVKAELGFATKISTFKIRLTANPGAALTYFEAEDVWDNSNLQPSDFKLSGKGQTAISFVWMPFARKWEDKD